MEVSFFEKSVEAFEKEHAPEPLPGITFHNTKPENPVTGDVYFDKNSNKGLVYTGGRWIHFFSEPEFYNEANR